MSVGAQRRSRKNLSAAAGFRPHPDGRPAGPGRDPSTPLGMTGGTGKLRNTRKARKGDRAAGVFGKRVGPAGSGVPAGRFGGGAARGGRPRGAGTEGGAEGVVEIVEVVEVFDFILVGFAEQAGGEEGEDDFAEVAGGADAPPFENGLGEGAERGQGVAAQAVGEFGPGDLADLFFAFPDFLEGKQEAFVQEEIGVGGVAGVGSADARDGLFEGGRSMGSSRAGRRGCVRRGRRLRRGRRRGGASSSSDGRRWRSAARRGNAGGGRPGRRRRRWPGGR